MDNTVNSAVVLPDITGFPDKDRPVKHALPARDLLMSAYASFSLMAAERFRRMTGSGQEVRVPLGEVAIVSVGDLLERHRITWGPYQSLKQALDTDPRFSTANPMLSEIEQVSGLRYLVAGAAGSYGAQERQVPTHAPQLGEHTEEVLTDILDLSTREIAKLHDKTVIAGG